MNKYACSLRRLRLWLARVGGLCGVFFFASTALAADETAIQCADVSRPVTVTRSSSVVGNNNVVGNGNVIGNNNAVFNGPVYLVNNQLCDNLKLQAEAELRAQLAARDTEVANKDREIAALVQARVRDAAAKQAEIDRVPEEKTREQLEDALRAANFKEVERLLANERDGRSAPVGLTAYALAFNAASSEGAAGGIIGELVHVPLVSYETIGVRISMLYEVAGGAAELRGHASAYFNIGGAAGIALRLGAPRGVEVGAYYSIGFTLHNYQSEDEFPLVPVGGELAVDYFDRDLRLGLFIRYMRPDVLYPSESPQEFVGIRVFFLRGIGG